MIENGHPALLASILETAVDAIIVIDEQGAIQSANPATERMFGFTVAELIGQNVKILMPSPYRQEHDGYLRHYRHTGERKIIGIGREVTGQRKDGSTFPLHLAVSEVQVPGRILFAGILRDISDLKEAQKDLSDLNARLDQRVQEQTVALREIHAELVKQEKLATLGQIAGGIAHEIRNPLNVVKTSAYYLLHSQNLTEAKTREHLQRIDRQVATIDSVITALSDIARLPEPRMDSCDVRQIIEDLVRGLTIRSNVKVENQLAPETPLAMVDRNQIPIVFRNLLRNACDAMPEGGTLTLSSDADPGGLVIHVSDTGVGIRPEDLAQITTPFFSTKARGMGLGLAISKAILEKNSGTLSVVSELGRGTTFSVRLPTTRSPIADGQSK